VKLLMHICCSNCSLYPLKSLLAQGIGVTGYWFNPNIHPLPEYERRLESLRFLERTWNVGMEYELGYGLDRFLAAVGPSDGTRCERCYRLRLEETAKTAGRMGLDGFTTTLLVSPYQRFGSLIAIGEELGKRYGILFHGEDFRQGYRASIPLSRELGLYRQKYCGCLYSEAERSGAGHG
jgi:hypothetical protein